MRNLKKVIALVAVFAMLVSTVAFAASYSDVADDNNYYEAIEMLSNLDILTGDDSDGDGVMDFRPNDTITRAEVAAIVCRIQNINNAAQQNTPFTDVTASHWASGYVAQAAGQNIINGNGDGTFDPEGNVLYEQAVKMFVRTIGYEPYVEANGGYYTGDLTAATRYGVLDGVVGGTPGVAATRGQIAQMAFNAIDTPLMDRYTYGKDAEYVIYDGKGDYDYESLLTRDLGVKKFSGILNENVVTDFSGGKDIDTSDEATVDFEYDENDDYYNYDIENDLDKNNATIYAGDVADDVYDLIGMHVNVYVKERDNSNEYEIMSIAASSKNKVVSYGLDQFDTVSGSDLKFFKNESSRTSDPIKVATEPIIFFNNVYYANDIENAFGDGELIEKDSKWSGKVTFVDNGGTSAYDVIKIEIASSGVIDEVTSNGKVTFKDVVKNASGDKIDLDFDPEEETQIVKITKDDKSMDWSELKEWDVVSILYNGDAEFYDVKSVGSNAIDGSIASRKVSSTSYDGYEYTIAGNSYDVAMFAYGANETKGWTPGTAGMFYVDEYGKIVAYDKNGSTTQSTTSGNYGYILNTQVTADDWGKQNIRIQMLDRSGKVAEGYLASKVKVEYPESVKLDPEDLKKNASDYENSYDIEKFGDIDKIANALLNQLVTYDVNSSGELKTITFWQTDEDENSLCLNDKAETYSYDEEDKELTVNGKYDVDDDTIIFYIRGDEDLTGLGSDKPASKTVSKVGTVASLAEYKGTTKYPAAVFDAENDIPAVVVIYNTGGGISPSSNVAVVDSVGSGYVDGDTCDSITYFLNGEKATSYIDPDATLVNFSDVDDLTQGSLVKLALSADGTMINEARVLAIYGGRDADEAGEAGYAELSDVDTSLNNIVFGPVYDYTSSSKRIRVFDGKDLTNYEPIKATNANVYVFDDSRAKNKLYVGDASDVNVDKTLRDKEDQVIESKTTGKVLVKSNELALGMMDYVVGVEDSEGDVLDVVIYKAPDFGRYTLKDAE